MYIESIKFQRIEGSEWEEGYYIGDTDNSDKSIIVDKDYNEMPKDEKGYRVWNYHTNLNNWIQLRIPERE